MAQNRPVSLCKQTDQGCLSLDSTFTFRCHEGLACFNRCCRKPTVILSPYDLLRLKGALGISAGEFLQRYTRREIEANSNLPLIFLDAFRSPESGCPFLGEGGCLVYAQRPAACRLFPITMGSQLTERGVVDYYFCRRLDYCQGFATQMQWTVASWKANQGFEEYDQGPREWLEILLRQGLQGPLAADAQGRNLMADLVYDLDRFRRLLMEPAFFKACQLVGPVLEHLRANDLALLKFAYRCLKAVLFQPDAELLDAALRSSVQAGEDD